MIPDSVNLERVAQLLGVDELQVNKASMGEITVRARLGDMWMMSVIEMKEITSAPSPAAAIGDQLRQLAESLLRSVTVDTATGADLDRIAMNLGVPNLRAPVEEEVRRPANRFEAVVEEMKKL